MPIRPSFDDSDSPAGRDRQREIVNRFHAAAPSDEGAEYERDNDAALVGLSSADPLFDNYVSDYGLDPSAPWDLNRTLTGDKIRQHEIRQGLVDPAVGDFQSHAARLQDSINTQFADTALSGANLVRSASEMHTGGRGISELLRGLSGTVLEGHGEAVLAGMQLGGSFEIGGYDFNHPGLVAGLAGRSNLANVEITLDEARHEAGHALLSHRSLTELAGTRGMGYNQLKEYHGRYNPALHYDPLDPQNSTRDNYRNYSHDHAKITGAGLRDEAGQRYAPDRITDAIRQQQLLTIGSANFTKGALGALTAGRPRYGFNIENTFVLHAGMIRPTDSVGLFLNPGQVSTALYDSLMGQGGRALDFTHSREAEVMNGVTRLDFTGRDFSVAGAGGYTDGGFQTRVLTNRGVVLEQQRQMERLIENKGTATLFINTLGNPRLNTRGVSENPEYDMSPFLERQVRPILEGSAGSRVDILYGIKFSGGLDLEFETANRKILEAFRASLSPDQQARFGLVQDMGRGMHAKLALLEFDNAPTVSIGGSTNNSNSSQNGSYDRDMPFRDLSVISFGDEMGGVEASARDIRNQLAFSSLTSLRMAGTSGFAPRGTEQALFDQYGLSSVNARLVSQGGGTVSARFAVGGVFQLNGADGTRGYLDLGSIKSLTALVHENGFAGSAYVPELTKFVGSVKGLGTIDPATNRRSKARDVDALEVLAAGTAHANRMVQDLLDALVETRGIAGTQRVFADPLQRGYLRAALSDQSRKIFENFQGVEPGRAIYGAKASMQLGFGIGANGLLDMGNTAPMGAAEIDSVLSGYSHAYDLGTGDFMFASGGLSRHRANGTRTPMRFYDMAMVDSLPMGMRRKRGDGATAYMFMMPLGKLAQLPQRLQTIMSARALDVQEDERLLSALNVGPEGTRSIVATSRFAGEDGVALRGIRLRGFAIPSMGGDNAYLVGEKFQDVFVGNETWSKTVKIHKDSAVNTTPGRLLVEAVHQMTALGHATELANGRYFIGHEQLTALQHRLPVAQHTQDGWGELLNEDLMLGTDKQFQSGLVLDLNSQTGTSLVPDAAGYFTFTVRGTQVRRMQSGDRSMIGGKFPFAFVQEASRAITDIRAYTRGLDTELYGRLGFESGGIDHSNAVFGTGTIKSGQALVETGIEVLESGAWRKQLDSLQGLNQLGDLSNTVRRYASMTRGGNHHAYSTLLDLANLLENKDNLGAADYRARVMGALEHQLGQTERFLKRHPNRALKMSEAGHTTAALLAFSLHAHYYLEQGKQAMARTGSDEMATLVDNFQMSFNKDYVRGSGMTLNDLTAASLERMTQMMLGSVPMTMVVAANAGSTAMSSRNRVNFLNYHAGGYADAFMDLMASAPEVMERASAYRELVSGGLLGQAGRNDVRFADDFNPMTRFIPGLTIEHEGKTLNPFREVLEYTEQLRGVFGGQTPATQASYEAMKTQQERYRLIHAETERVRTGAKGLGAPFHAGGSPESTAVQAHLRVLRAAGVGARAFMLPQIGRMNASGHFEMDAAATGEGSVVRLVNVGLVSADALLSLGSFEDYSAEMQRLQVKIERGMRVIPLITDQGGVLHNRMDANDQRDYRDLMGAVGALQHVMKEAAATGLQKLMGGQLAMPGRNFVVGTLPDVPEGIMVLGSEAWRLMREDAVADLMRGLQGAVDLPKDHLGPQEQPEQAWRRAVDALANSLSDPEAAAGYLSHMKGTSAADARLARTEAEIARLQDLRLTRRAQADQKFGRTPVVYGPQRAGGEFQGTYHQAQDELGQLLVDVTHQTKTTSKRALKQDLSSWYRNRFALVPELDAFNDERSALHGQIAEIRAERVRLNGQRRGYSTERSLGDIDSAYRALDYTARQVQDRLASGQTLLRHAQQTDEAFIGLKRRRNQLLRQSESYEMGSYQEELLSPLGLDYGHDTSRTRRVSQDYRNFKSGLVEYSEEYSNLRDDLHQTEYQLYQMKQAHKAEKKAFKAEQLELLTPLRDQLKSLKADFKEKFGSGGIDFADLEATDYDTAHAMNRAGGYLAEAEQHLHLLERSLGSQQHELSQAMKGQVRGALVAQQHGQVNATVAAVRSRKAALKAERNRLQGGHQGGIVGTMPYFQLFESETGSRMPGVHDAADSFIDAQLDHLYKLQAKQQLSSSSIQKQVENALHAMLDNQGIRGQLMKGTFQRAGAPFGPYGLVATDIWTADEFNATNPALLIHGSMSQTSVFMNINAMAYNLGDFDGDTGSVTYLKEFGYLEVKSRMHARGLGPALTDLEHGLRHNALEKLSLSPQEVTVKMHRAYTGFHDLLSDQAMYIGGDSGLQSLFGVDGKGAEKAREHLLGLQNAAVRSDADRATLAAYSHRKSIMSGIALASNEYANVMHDAHDDVRQYMADNAGRLGMDRNALFREFFRTSAADRALAGFKKMQRVVSDSVSESEKKALKVAKTGLEANAYVMSGKLKDLTHNQLVSFFVMASYAKSTIMGSTFEAAYALQAEATRYRASGLFNIYGDAQHLLGNDVDIAQVPARLHGHIAQGLDTDGVARGLLDRYEPYNVKHARLTGSYLVLQQMAREAIKPKSGDDQLDNMRTSTGGKEDAVASAIDAANKGVRPIALDWFHTLVSGEGMLANHQDATGRGKLRRYDADHGTYHVRTAQGEALVTLGQIHQEIADGLYDFHMAGIKGLIKRNNLNADSLGKLFGGHSAAPADLAALKEGLSPEERDTQLKAYARAKTFRTAGDLVDDAVAGRAGRETKLAYMRALHSKKAGAFERQSARMDAGEKLFVLEQVVSRGKFDVSSAGDMERAFSDLFSHFNHENGVLESQRMKELAFEKTGNHHFADHVSATYKAWASGHDMASAIKAGRRASRAGFEKAAADGEYAKTLRTALVNSHKADGSWSAETEAGIGSMDLFQLAKHVDDVEAKHQEVDKTHTNLGAKDADGQKLLDARHHIRAAAYQDEVAGSFAGGALPGRVAGAQGAAVHAAGVADRNAARMDQGLHKAATSSHTMGVVGGLVALGFMASSASPADAAEAIGSTAAGMVALANPNLLLRDTAQHSSPQDRVAALAVAGTSLVTGAVAGHLAYQHGVEHAASRLQAGGVEAGELLVARAGMAGMGLSALAGLAGAVVGGTLAAAIAQRFGFLKNMNPVPEMVAAMTELGAMGTNSGQFASDVDEVAGIDEASATGVVEIRDAAGELVAQEFYTFTPGAMEGDSEDPDLSSMMDSGLDTQITGGGFDSNATRASDSLALAKDVDPAYL